MSLRDGQTHWPNCATEGGPRHYECAVAEIKRLHALIKAAGKPWLELDVTPPIPWEGGIDGAMRAACAEITRLRALTTPQPIETAPRDGTVVLVEGYYDGDDKLGWRQSYWAPGGYWAWTIDAKRWLPRPENQK